MSENNWLKRCLKSRIYSQEFTLSSPEDVYFFLGDHPTSDNHGGVSLAVTAVPESAVWAQLIVGFGTIGLLLVCRRHREDARTAS